MANLLQVDICNDSVSSEECGLELERSYESIPILSGINTKIFSLISYEKQLNFNLSYSLILSGYSCELQFNLQIFLFSSSSSAIFTKH